MKNNMKKLIASGLVLTSIFAAVNAMAYVPNLEEISPDKGNETHNTSMLSKANSGIQAAKELFLYTGIAGEEINTLDLKKPATRALAAKYFAGIAGDNKGTKKAPYSDVSEKTDYFDGIYAAYSAGILENTKTFRPDDEITKEEAARMAMYAVGYNKLFEDNKAMLFAQSNDLFKGVETKENVLTAEGLITMVENTLLVPFVEITDVSLGSYKINKGDTSYLEEYKDIVMQKGIVTAIGYTSIYGDSDLMDNEIEINRGVFETANTPDKGLVGSSVGAYVDISDNEQKIVTTWEFRNSSVEIKDINTDEVESSYIMDSESKKHRISSSARTIYNDVYYGSYEQAFADKKLDKFSSLVLIDNNDDNNYDVVKIYKADTYVVKAVSSFTEKIMLKYGFEDIILDENKTINSVYKNGSKIEYTGISKDEVISVYEAQKADGKKVYTIYTSADSVTDTYNGIRTEGNKRYYLIGKEKYPLSDNFIYYLENDTTEKKPSLGEEFTFLLSNEGEIAGATSKAVGFGFGWLMKSYVDDDNDEKISIKLYLPEGSSERYELKPKVKYYDADFMDGVRLTSTEVKEKLGKGETEYYGLIGFKLNSEKLVSEIVMPIDRTGKEHATIDYPLTKDYTNLKGYDSNGKPKYNNVRSYTNILDVKYKVSGVDTFAYPVDKTSRADESQYSKTTIAGQDKYYGNEELVLYNISKYFIPQIITVGMEIKKEIGNKESAFMVVDSYEGLNSDDEAVKIIRYSNGIAEMEKVMAPDCAISNDKHFWYGTPESAQDLRAGDIIQLSLNLKDEINCVRVLYKSDNPSPIGYQDTNDRNMYSLSDLKVVHGIVKDINRDSIVTDLGDDGLWPAYEISNVYGNISYTMFEAKTGKVTPITRDDVEVGDEIIYRKAYNNSINFFVIR